MTPKEALTARIQFLREREDQQRKSLLATKSEIADLIAQKDALTLEAEQAVTDLCRVGVVKVGT